MRRGQSGQTSLLALFFLTALLGLGALVVDAGRAMVVREGLQTAVDAAAAAAAGQMERRAEIRVDRTWVRPYETLECTWWGWRGCRQRRWVGHQARGGDSVRFGGSYGDLVLREGWRDDCRQPSQRACRRCADPCGGSYGCRTRGPWQLAGCSLAAVERTWLRVPSGAAWEGQALYQSNLAPLLGLGARTAGPAEVRLWLDGPARRGWAAVRAQVRLPTFLGRVLGMDSIPIAARGVAETVER